MAAAAVTKGIMLVITQVLLMDEFILTIKPRTMGVVLMVGLTTKDSCQVAYQSKGKDYFSCQKMTNAPTGGGSNSGGGGFGFGGRSNTNGGGGGFDGFGGSGH